MFAKQVSRVGSVGGVCLRAAPFFVFRMSGCGAFPFRFIQESEERVNEINRRLKDDGFAVEPPQSSHGWTF